MFFCDVAVPLCGMAISLFARFRVLFTGNKGHHGTCEISRRIFGKYLVCLFALCLGLSSLSIMAENDTEPVRVFIFAGQSNMVGSDSHVKDIKNFPPFRGLEESQEGVRFSYCIGRENKMRSNGWVDLQPVDGVVGPELSFAREVRSKLDAPIAIIKCAAGGTHLGGDWNPDDPSGFRMYPVLMDLVRDSLARLDADKIPYRMEGFMWHQGENDMFNASYMAEYGTNLSRFIECVRRDLNAPNLRFYIGELCTKTIWGMDLRPRMFAISLGQKSVTQKDPLAQYIHTSHVGVEIGRPVGLHYHYGTLGQLEHGVNYAEAYLKNIGLLKPIVRPLKRWPYPQGKKVKLFVLTGHRNMEGERAFVQELRTLDEWKKLVEDQNDIAFKYDIGGGYRVSNGWEPLGPIGYYDTFGPELSFGAEMNKHHPGSVAIAKFTHSGSQIIDWTPEGSEAPSRNLYPKFLEFVQNSMKELKSKGHDVELSGVFYHLGENDMSFHPYRKQAATRLVSIIRQTRIDLEMPELKWYVTQQAPLDHENLNKVDVLADVSNKLESDPFTQHIKVGELPGMEKELIISTEGILELGQLLARAYIKSVQDN